MTTNSLLAFNKLSEEERTWLLGTIRTRRAASDSSPASEYLSLIKNSQKAIADNQQRKISQDVLDAAENGSPFLLFFLPLKSAFLDLVYDMLSDIMEEAGLDGCEYHIRFSNDDAVKCYLLLFDKEEALSFGYLPKTEKKGTQFLKSPDSSCFPDLEILQ